MWTSLTRLFIASFIDCAFAILSGNFLDTLDLLQHSYLYIWSLERPSLGAESFVCFFVCLFCSFDNNVWTLWWELINLCNWFCRSVVLPIFLFVAVILNCILATMNHISSLFKNPYSWPTFLSNSWFSCLNFCLSAC